MMTAFTDQPAGKTLQTVLFVLVGLLLLAAPVCYFLFDQATLEFLTSHRLAWPEDNHWVNAFRQLGKAWVIIWLLLLHAWIARHTRTLIPAILSLLLVMTVVSPLKFALSRPRPEHVLSMQHHPEKTINRWKHHSQSFPSGDTATVFAVAATVSLVAAWYWSIPFLAAASAIGALRVFTLDHFPSDVCAGAAIGVLAGWFAVRLARQHCLPEVVSLLGRWRKMVLMLLLILPAMAAFESHNPLLTFLKTYGLFIAAFCFIWHLTHRQPDS